MIADFNIWDPSLIDKLSALQNNPTNISKIILNAATEHQYDYIAGRPQPMLDLIEFTRNKNIELHIITGAHPTTKLLNPEPHIHIHAWATFWLTMTMLRLSVEPNYSANLANNLNYSDIQVGKNYSLEHPFITMNKAPKVHRAIMMDMLAKHDLIDKGIVIWREPCLYYQYEHWEEKILLVDQKEQFVSQETLPPGYANTFAQLITESDEYLFFLTEKTSMALFFNKPFLVAGSKHFHRLLKEMGFLLYDELFDYSFDEIENVKDRYDMLAQNFIKYAQKTPAELKKLYDQVFEKCVYNKKLAIKLALTTKPKIWDELVEYQARNNIEEYPMAINIFIKNNESIHGFK